MKQRKNKVRLYITLTMLMFIQCSFVNAQHGDRLLFHETFDLNKNWDFSGIGIGGFATTVLFDNENNWDNYKSVGRGLYSAHFKFNGELTTRKFHEIIDVSDVTIQIKIGKPFGLFSFAAGAASQILGIEPKVFLSVLGGNENTYVSTDHLSLGGWRSTFWGSTIKTFTIHNATSTTQLKITGKNLTQIYDIKFYVENEPYEAWNIDDIITDSDERSGWVKGYVTSFEKDNTEPYQIKIDGKVILYDIYTLKIRDEFTQVEKTLDIPLYTKEYESSSEFKVFPYHGIEKIMNINNVGDLINSKVYIHANFDKITKVQKNKTATEETIHEKISDVDKVIIMTPAYVEMSDYRLKNDANLQYFQFDGFGKFGDNEYFGPSVNYLYYINSTSNDLPKMVKNVCSVGYDMIDTDDIYFTRPLPELAKANNIDITDDASAKNRDFWCLYKTEVTNIPTYDRIITNDCNYKTYIAPFDAKVDNYDYFTAYTLGENSIVETINGVTNITLEKSNDRILRHNTPYLLVPKDGVSTTLGIRANDNIIYPSVAPTKKTNKWNFTGTFRRLNNAQSYDYGAVVVSKNKLYQINIGTQSYVPALRSFLQSPIGFGVVKYPIRLILTPSNEPVQTTNIDGNKFLDLNKNSIYSIDGKYIGTDMNKLEPGIYIINGKKCTIK